MKNNVDEIKRAFIAGWHFGHSDGGEHDCRMFLDTAETRYEDYQKGHVVQIWNERKRRYVPCTYEATKMTGTIKKLLTDKNCGFIRGEDGVDYFFHKSALKNADYDNLHEGDDVTFEDAEGQKGPRAEDIYV